MNPLRPIFGKLPILFRRTRFRRELEDEMAFHRAQMEQEFVDHGFSRENARYAAMRQFGNTAQIKERSQQLISFSFEQFLFDCRYALRQLRRSPGFAVAVAGTLALGIGATTAVFTIVYAALVRSLPYPEADRIVAIRDVRIQGQSNGGLVAVPRYFDLEARNRSLVAIGFFFFDHPTLIDGSNLPVSMKAVSASAGFWKVYGVAPLLGRTFNEHDDEPNAPAAAVISYRAWRQVFGGDPTVVGRQVSIDRRSATIVGVMPQTFDAPTGIDLWRPAQFVAADWLNRVDGFRFINVFARLAPGVTVASAQRDVDRIGAQLQRDFPASDGLWQFRTTSLRDDRFGEVRPALLILQTASLFLLLIACFNVANLLLARATARQREVALRRALGASETRIRMQLLIESTMLALIGGAAGITLTITLVRFAAAQLPDRLGMPGFVTVNWPVVWFAFVLAVGAGIVFGLAPSLASRRALPSLTLKLGNSRGMGASGGRLRSVLTSVQVALSLVLLVGAALLAQSLWNLVRSPLGFVPDHVLTFRLNLPWDAKPAAVRDFYSNVQRRLSSLPGVVAVGQITALPSEDWHFRQNYDADWLPRTAHSNAMNVEVRSISGDYLRAIGTSLLAGRVFTTADLDPNAPFPVLVNRAFVQMYANGRNPIGRHIINSYGPADIVGVVADVRGTAGSIAHPIGPEVYVLADAGDHPDYLRTFVVRSALPPDQLIQAIREQIREVDPAQAISGVSTMDELLDKAVAQPRLNMVLVAAFAFIAILLACVGIYGVVAWSVAQRVQEIGVRMALGATRSRISFLFLRRAAVAALAGLTAGTLAAFALTRLLRSQLYGVSPGNPWIYAASAAALFVAVMLATLRPVLAAASINPTDALRVE